MIIPVRTLSPQDAEILARTVETGMVSNGCVECHGLRWRSDALRTWEIEQRCLGRKPEVSIRIDELDLSTVYVDVLQGERRTYRATSTQPRYSKCLSLFEHNRLKAALKRQAIRDRLVQMSDDRAFNLRLEYHAALGRADDPVAYRRLVGLRDALAALRSPEPVGPPNNAPSVSQPRPAIPAPRLTMAPRRRSRAKEVLPKSATSTPPAVELPVRLISPDVSESRRPVPEPKSNVAPLIPFPQLSIKRKLT